MDYSPSSESSIAGALANLTHGVYVLATRRGQETSTMTASWVAKTSDRPPCVAVAVREDRYTHNLILESATFALSVLREDQVDVAAHFSDTSSEYNDKLRGIPYGLTPGGSPHLLDCIAYVDCRVLDTVRAGEHTLVIGEVTAGEALGGGYPLLYDPSEYEGALH
ncbi:MAG: flavin reductase family protein [Rubrobacteraceae bacterium]